MSRVSEKASKPAVTTDTFDVLIGESVFLKFSEPSMKEQWNQLYNSCPWATAFQGWGFIYTWYDVFRDTFVPVVVTSTDAKGQLSGLLCMAIHSDQASNLSKVKIVGAGEYDSEYQTWLSHTYNRDIFIRSALELLREKFPSSDIIFRFIPDGSLIDWLQKDPYWRKRAVIQPFRRPLMLTDSPDIGKILTLQRQFKSKLNRLKRLGTVKFEQVTKNEQFEEILPDLMVNYDFRQAAMFNKNQFRESPNRREFFLQLFRNDILHVTLLLLNGEIIGCLAGVAGKQWVHLQGINTHSPFYSKYSPGILHFYQLGKHLTDDGDTAVFDLTPGGDSYKERWATDHDTVYHLTLAGSMTFFVKRSLKKSFHSLLIRFNLRPMTVELMLEKNKYLLKQKGLRGMLAQKKLASRFILENYRQQASRLTTDVKKNSLADLLDFEDKYKSVTRWEFIENAMKLLGEGFDVYTYSNGELLLACIWISYQETTPHQKGNEAASEPILSSPFCHPSFANNFREFLSAVFIKLAPEEQRIFHANLDPAEKQLFSKIEDIKVVAVS